MFLGRQAAITSASNCCFFLANRHHFLFIDSHHQQSQLKKKKKKNNFINDRHHQQFIGIKQQQQPFGSLHLLESTKDGKQTKQQQAHSPQSNLSNYYNTQVGASNKMLLLLMVEQQNRFFATATTSSSSFGEEQPQQRRKQQNELVENGSSRGEEHKKTGETLAHKWMRLDATSILHLNLRQGEQRKYFKLIKSSMNRSNIVANIGLPNLTLEVGYPLVSAMDSLMKSLLAKHDGQVNINQSLVPLVLESQHIDAYFFDLQLELVWLGGNAYMVKISSIKAVKEHKASKMRFPIRALPWLRHAMAQMLVEHDHQGSQQQLGQAPPELPEFILQARPARNRPPQPQFRSSNQRQPKQRFFSAAETSSSSAAHQHIGKEGSSKEAKEQQKQLPTFPKEETLAHKWMLLDSTSKLRLNLEQGEQRKFFCLTKSFAGRNNVKFPNFAVGYGYPLVSAMDVLLKTLTAAFKHQEEFNHSAKHHQQLGPLMLLQSQRVNTYFFDIQLELVRLGNVQNAYVFKVKIVKTVGELRERELLFPVRALPWLRHAMAQMLVEHDGSQQLGPAPPLPWELLETIFQVCPLPPSPLPPVAAVQTRLRPQFLNQQRQQQQKPQQFASHQRKPSAANRLPSPPPFYGQQQFHRFSPHRSSPSSNFGAAPLPQQQQQPKITNGYPARITTAAGHGKATAQNQQNDAFRMRKRVVQQTAGQWRNRQPQQPNNRQQQRTGTGQAWMNNRNKWVNNKPFSPPPPPTAVQTRRRPQLHNNQRQQQQQQFASHQAPSSSARRLLPSPPSSSFYGQQQHHFQATYHQPQAKKFVQTAAAAVTGRQGTTANQQQNSFQTRKPVVNQANHQQQNAAGQWSHRQPQISRQQQNAFVGGQATRLNSNRSRTAKLPTLPPPSLYGQQQFQATYHQQQNALFQQTKKQANNQANKQQQQTVAGQWNHRRQEQRPISQQQYQQQQRRTAVAGQATGMDMNSNKSRTAKLPTPSPPSFYGQQQFHRSPHQPTNNRFAQTTAVTGRHGTTTANHQQNSFQTWKPMVNQANQLQQNAGQWNHRRQQQPPITQQRTGAAAVGVAGQATRMDSNKSRTAKLPTLPPPSLYDQQQFHHQSPPHQQLTTNNNRFAQTTAVDGRHGYHQGIEILFNSFQTRKPVVNQANQQQQTAAGQWNHRQQPPISQHHQQQRTGAVSGGQATRMNSSKRATANNNPPLSPPSPLPPPVQIHRLPINKATANTNAGTRRVASVPWPQQQNVHRQQQQPEQYPRIKKKTIEAEEEDMEVKAPKTPLNKGEEGKAEEEEEADDIFKLLHEVEALAKEVEEEKSRRRSAIGNDDDGRKRRRK